MEGAEVVAKLVRESNNQVLIPNLRIAASMGSRMRGLLGTASLPETDGLWIHRCNSIHTFFMQYPIDCVFLDRNMVVKSVVANVVPGRMVFPRLGASSVVEMKAGTAQTLQIQKGEKLNVGN